MKTKKEMSEQYCYVFFKTLQVRLTMCQSDVGIQMNKPVRMKVSNAAEFLLTCSTDTQTEV